MAATASGSSSLDPPLLLGEFTLPITMQVYESLVKVTEDLELEGRLATSWEANDDLTSYTFHLREGVTFHHGKEFKAEDVIYSFNRLLDPEIDSPARSTLAVIENMVEVDDHTVRFELASGNAFFPEVLSIYQAKIHPSDVDPSRLALEAIGTGAFMLEEYLPNERATLSRNPDYWEEGRPYLDEVIIEGINEPATRSAALKSGDVDLIYLLSIGNGPDLKSYGETKVLETASASYLNLAMRTDMPPFDDVLVRRAFQAATDRVSINQAALAGLGSVANDHPIPPSDPHFASDCAPPAYDPELAKSLLEQAGYPDGIEVTLHTMEEQNMGELAVAFKESAAAAGIDVTIQRDPSDAYWADVWLVVPFTTVFWFGRPPDQALSIVYPSDASWNESYYFNTTLDDLIIEARGQENLADRKATYKEVQCLLVDEVPRIVAVFQPQLLGARNEVQGVRPHPRGWIYLVDAWLDN
jgi:peptide/nickel transport system substrate-binding protein